MTVVTTNGGSASGTLQDTAAANDAGSSETQAGSGIAPHHMWLGLALLLTALAYGATLEFQFVYDDLPQIVGNPVIHSWSNALGTFTHHVWSQMAPGAP